MITLVETAVAAFISAQVAGLSQIDFPVAVRPATSKELMPKDRPVIIAQCTDLPNDVAGSPEWTAALAIYIATDSSLQSSTAARHATLQLALTAMFVPENAAALSDCVAAEMTGYTAASFARLAWRPGRVETTWADFLAISLQVTGS